MKIRVMPKIGSVKCATCEYEIYLPMDTLKDGTISAFHYKNPYGCVHNNKEFLVSLGDLYKVLDIGVSVRNIPE